MTSHSKNDCGKNKSPVFGLTFKHALVKHFTKKKKQNYLSVVFGWIDKCYLKAFIEFLQLTMIERIDVS